MAAVQELEKPISTVAPEPRLESSDDASKLIEQQDALKGVLKPTIAQPSALVVNDDVTDQSLLTPTGAQVPEIILPETEEQAKADLKTSPDETKHWLGAWVLRMISMAKKIGAKIVFKQS